MITRRNFLKIGCGAVASALLMSQRPKHSFAMSNHATQAGEAVILLSAPSINDTYYRQFFDDLLAFYARFVSIAHPKDVPLVMVDSATFARASAVIPVENLIIGNIPDIWVRDFSPIRSKTGNFDFRYAPQYLELSEASYIERRFNSWYSATRLTKKGVALVLDGGNFNYNGVDSAVTTERVLKDNPRYSKKQITNTIKLALGLTRLAIIPEEPGDITGHSDGMVVWLAPNKLGVARFSEPLRSQVRNALTSALPNVQLVELPYAPQPDQWQDWSSAKGVYVNALSTANALYVPMFGLAQDAEALAIYRQHAAKPVIPVQVGAEVNMGGSVRCLTWEVDGADAQTLLTYYNAYDVYAAAAAPIVEENLSDETVQEEITVEIGAEEVDNETEGKIFSAYLPLINR